MRKEQAILEKSRDMSASTLIGNSVRELLKKRIKPADVLSVTGRRSSRYARSCRFVGAMEDCRMPPVPTRVMQHPKKER